MRSTIPDFMLERPKQAVATVDGLQLRLAVAMLTPMVGGGAVPKRSDDSAPVRVPSIRGQLRAFWRATRGANLGLAELRRREFELWGGLLREADEPGRDAPQRKNPAQKSLVAVEVEVTKPGRTFPAGEHERNAQNNGFSPLPTWAAPFRDLGYALFPLQRSSEELNGRQYSSASSVPTDPVRVELEFTLVVTIASRAIDQGRGNEVIDALLAWLWLGGLGARTTRGLGKLRLVSVQHLGNPSSAPRLAFLERLAASPGPGLWADWWRELACRTTKANRAWVTFDGLRMFTGPERKTPNAAIADLLGALRFVRQEPGFARRKNPNDPRRPGQSFWVEPDTARVTFARLKGSTPKFEHPPLNLWPAGGPDGRAAPRAAFGLPLAVKFKRQDREDSRASGRFLPRIAGGGKLDRWTSPLRFCVVPTQTGFVPMAVALYPRPGDSVIAPTVELEFDDRSANEGTEAVREIPVADRGATLPPVNALVTSGGDAVAGFLEFLRSKHGFKDCMVGATK